MATKYQQVLAIISRAEKGEAYPSDMAQIFEEFADEVIEDIESGIEVKQHAAVQKMKELISLFNEIKESGEIQGSEEMLTPTEKIAIQEMNEKIKKKVEQVEVAHKKMREK